MPMIMNHHYDNGLDLQGSGQNIHLSDILIRRRINREEYMVDIKEIDQAIAAHGYWKTYLRNAITTGRIDTPVETICSDSRCVFGKWLDASMLTSTEKESYHYITVKGLHARFHETAARVAGLVLAGKKSEAERMMAPDGEYAKISAQLSLAMMGWRKSLSEKK